MLDNSDPSNILSPVRGISWVILELYTITPIRASPGPIWSLSIKCIRVSFSLLKSVEVMLSEPSTKKIKSTTPRQPVKYVIDTLLCKFSAIQRLTLNFVEFLLSLSKLLFFFADFGALSSS
jgi:hypothetical protein